jgi:hypothetical protein
VNSTTGAFYIADTSNNVVEQVAPLTSQTVSFTSTAPTSPVAGGTYTPTATATSGLAVTFSIDASSGTGVCSISAGVVSFNVAGTCIIDAKQAGNTTYAAAKQVQASITVKKATTPPPATSTTPPPSTPVTPIPVTTPTPPTPRLVIPGGFGRADTTQVTSLSPARVSTNVTTTVSANVTVPAGALASGSTIAIVRQQGKTAISAKVPPEFGQTASFAVTWITPQGTSAPAATPLSVVLTGTALRRGDVIYTETAGGLKAVDVVHTSGSATVGVTDPGSEFVVAAPPVSSAPARVAHKSAVAAAVQVSCVSGAICEGPATLSVARKAGGHVSHPAVAIATVRVDAGGAPVVRFALTAFGKALVRAHHGKAFDVTLLVKTSFGNRLVRRIALG